MEPNYTVANILLFVLPFGAYYIGILIRRYALPGDSSSTLICQFLLGIPMSIGVVTAILATVNPNTSNVLGYLSTLGIIMEHGMVLNEAVISRLSDRAKQTAPAIAS
jgi:hypothetical protein